MFFKQSVDYIPDRFHKSGRGQQRVEFRGHDEFDDAVGLRHRITTVVGYEREEQIDETVRFKIEFVENVCNRSSADGLAEIEVIEETLDIELFQNLVENARKICDIGVVHVITMYGFPRRIIVEVDVNAVAERINTEYGYFVVVRLPQNFEGNDGAVIGARAYGIDRTFQTQGIFLRFSVFLDFEGRSKRESYVPVIGLDRFCVNNRVEQQLSGDGTRKRGLYARFGLSSIIAVIGFDELIEIVNLFRLPATYEKNQRQGEYRQKHQRFLVNRFAFHN